MEMEVPSSRDGRIGCSSAEGASEFLSRSSRERLAESRDIFLARGTLELLGVDLWRVCKESSDQQQDIGELMDKRVAATGFDPASIMRMMMQLALQVDKEDVIAFCLGRGAVVHRRHMEAVADWRSFASHKKMIEAKAVDINFVAGWYGDILSVAVLSKNFEWAKFCLENGARPNISVVHGYKLVIAYAASDGFQAMVELLLDFGAKLRGSGAIVLAAAAGQTEMVRWLLAKGADVNEVMVDSCYYSKEHEATPLHRAITNKHKEEAKLLIENGANLALRDLLGRTPIKLAKLRRPDWLSKRVTGQGAAVPVTGKKG